METLARAYINIYNGKSRHIGLRHAYVKQLMSDGIITIVYVRSCRNLVDPFTKGLPRDMIFGSIRDMGLCNAPKNYNWNLSKFRHELF